MRKFLLIVAVIVVITAALVFYLITTTPSKSGGIRFPLSAEQRELLASVPESADAFALIPTAAAFREKLLANAITRGAVEAWSDAQQVPRSWMLGGADLVIWRAGEQTGYTVLHVDPLRRMLIRFFKPETTAAQPIASGRLEQLLSITNGLEPADAMIVQQTSSRGAFPPIERPAVTTIKINHNEILLTSVAAGASPAGRVGARGATPSRARFPRGALLAATFHEPPRVIGELDRLLLARVSHLLDDGGSIVLYDVNPGTLLPRPDGLIVAKATADNRITVERIRSVVETFGEMRETGDDILLSFDRDSMRKYSSDTFVDALWPSNDWSARIDPKHTVPLLEKLGDSTGLRLAAPRLYRSARDLRHWIEVLSAADSIEASHSTSGTTEDLRVRIASK